VVPGPLSFPVEVADEVARRRRRRAPGITKRFPGVVANDDVDLDVKPGEVHAIVGENGAGKSTLMKILYGMHQPDEGTITVDGEELVFASPKDAIAAGIGMVHQHFMLADNFTVLENIVLGEEPGTGLGKLDAHARAHPIRAGRALRPRGRSRRARLRPRGRRQAAGRDPQGALPRCPHPDPRRADRRARAPGGRRPVPQPARAQGEGATIIFISHKLDEVLKHADAITVIRQGKTVGEVDPSSVTAASSPS
jgi:general nucleoside transport system ATP-binding protein